MSKKFTVEIKDDGSSSCSDGYHTFDELYEHRCMLFILLCLSNPKKSAWKTDYDGWFCLYLELPTGQISYHVPNKFLPYVWNKLTVKPDYKWDGHTSEVALERIKETATFGPITNDEDHKRYLKEFETLMDLDPKEGTEEAKRLKMLASYMEDYELKRWPIS